MEAPGTKLTENFAAKGKRDWLPRNVSHILEPSWRNTRNISDSFVRSFVQRNNAENGGYASFSGLFAEPNGKSRLLLHIRNRHQIHREIINDYCSKNTCETYTL